MALACTRAHRFRGLNGDHIVAFGRKPGCVPARAGANVEDRCTGRWQQVQQCRVNMLERQRFVLGDQLIGILIVMRNGLQFTFGMFFDSSIVS